MNYSYYEVYTNALRAFSGMGFPYGADEDAAYIIAWLELNNLNGVKHLVNSIDKIDKKYNGKIIVKKSEFNINFKNSSALMKGPGLIDYLCLKFVHNKKFEFIINNCSEAEIFLPLLYRISNKVICSGLIYINENNENILCIIKNECVKIGVISKDMNIKKNNVKILMSNKRINLKFVKIIKEIKNDFIYKNLSKALRPEKKYWEIIEKIAYRTFVPESKESRAKGAGGSNDND